MKTPPTRSERLEGGIIGLLVGDALGVPYEFHSAEQLPAMAELEFDPPRQFERSHPGVPPGTYSDDGAHALILLDSLLYTGRLDLEDLGRRLVNWRDLGYMAVDYKVFDVGLQTDIALSRLRSGAAPLEAGPSSEGDNGNGALMRVLPLALWHGGTDRELVRDAELQSRITHGHLRSQVCCSLYCLWIRCALLDSRAPWEDAVRSLRSLYPEGTERRSELELHIRPDDPAPGTGTGYVVDCLRSARCASQAGDFEAVVRAAVAIGNDTDTTAAVAGGFAGVREGVRAIPSRWRDRLQGGEWYSSLVAKIVAARGSENGAVPGHR